MTPKKEKKQFLKFCLVGASGTFVDFLILNVLLVKDTPLVLAGTISFAAAVINNFLWHSQWTFRGSARKNRALQVLQFTLISVIGLLIRLPILYLGSLIDPNTLTRIGLSPQTSETLIHNLCTAIAIGVVLGWNYLGNKHWTFQPPKKTTKKNLDGAGNAP
jgi:putative flippase GtrA